MEYRRPCLSVLGVFKPERGTGDRVSAAVGFGDGHRAGNTGVFAPNLELLSVRSHGENIWCRICLVAVRGFQLFDIVVAEADDLAGISRRAEAVRCPCPPFGYSAMLCISRFGAAEKPSPRRK